MNATITMVAAEMLCVSTIQEPPSVSVHLALNGNTTTALVGDINSNFFCLQQSISNFTK